MTDAFLV